MFGGAFDFHIKNFNYAKYHDTLKPLKIDFWGAFDFVIAIFFCYRATSYATVKLSKENIVKVLHVHIVGNKCFNIHTSKKAYVIRVKCQSRW